MSSLKPIHHTFGPAVDWLYTLKATGWLFKPWRWQTGPAREQLRAALSKHYQADVHLFASGREALLALLTSLNFPPGSEIIIQGFTCMVLPNAIHAAGYTPVYADLERSTLNLDPDAVRQKITSRTKAIICQHTFGIPAPLNALQAICNEHGLQLIEDCAHAIFDPLGQTGNFTLLSFGRDKAISGITGGALVSRNGVVSDILKQTEASAPPLPRQVIARLLCYPGIYFKLRPLIGLGGLGKGLLIIAKKLGLLVPVLKAAEKAGHPTNQIHQLPNACSALAHWQLKELAQINQHRQTLVEYYQTIFKQADLPSLPLQKYPLLIKDPSALKAHLKTLNIHLDDGWSGTVVCPAGCNQAAANYQTGSCPQAQSVADHIISLPTHPTMSLQQAKVLSKIIIRHSSFVILNS